MKIFISSSKSAVASLEALLKEKLAQKETILKTVNLKRKDIAQQQNLVISAKKQLHYLESHHNSLSDSIQTLNKMIGSVRKRQSELDTEIRAENFKKGFSK